MVVLPQYDCFLSMVRTQVPLCNSEPGIRGPDLDSHQKAPYLEPRLGSARAQYYVWTTLYRRVWPLIQPVSYECVEIYSVRPISTLLWSFFRLPGTRYLGISHVKWLLLYKWDTRQVSSCYWCLRCHNMLMIVKGTILLVTHEDMIEHVTQVCPLRSRWLPGYVVWCEVSLKR